jgi:hypothetical protein
VTEFLNIKLQIPNIKRFDKLTTLSKVEGQITMTKIPNLTLLKASREAQLNIPLQVICFGHWEFVFGIYL